MTIHERYRPQQWSDVVGQEKAIAKIRRIIERPDFRGDAFWIVGPSGCGKTSAARIAAAQLAHPWNVFELDGEACTVDAVREARQQMDYTPLGGRLKVWIVNEAQAMTPKAAQAWLTVLDPVPNNVVVIFTTTEDSTDIFGDYSRPFMSRVKEIPLTSQGLAPLFAARAKQIAEAEGLDGQPIEKYAKLAKDCHNNMRAMLQRIELGEMIVD
jgi:replication-associated recombination protein RarA